MGRMKDLWIEMVDEGHEVCPACGQFIDYCQGHGAMTDEAGAEILDLHDADNHQLCHAYSECNPDR